MIDESKTLVKHFRVNADVNLMVENVIQNRNGTRSWWRLRHSRSKPTNCIREINITRPRDQRAKWLYGRKLLIVCNHPTRVGGHRDCGSIDKDVFNFSRELMWPYFKRFVWLNGLISLYIPILPKLTLC